MVFQTMLGLRNEKRIINFIYSVLFMYGRSERLRIDKKGIVNLDTKRNPTN